MRCIFITVSAVRAALTFFTPFAQVVESSGRPPPHWVERWVMWLWWDAPHVLYAAAGAAAGTVGIVRWWWCTRRGRSNGSAVE